MLCSVRLGKSATETYEMLKAAAVPTQEKFTEENVHIKVQKNIYQQFQQTRLPFNRHSRTPGSRTAVHVLMGEKKKMSGAS
ncbi:hypothetical protein TNCV_3883021 [Trichonephila clavipes]|nr:hypothetical protein TNCV_3883021 [Trichonephila clavipes]